MLTLTDSEVAAARYQLALVETSRLGVYEPTTPLPHGYRAHPSELGIWTPTSVSAGRCILRRLIVPATVPTGDATP
jgi:hypothetical protein